MFLFLLAMAAGAVLVVLLFMIKGAIKLFLPQRAAMTFDRGFDAAMVSAFRWIMRAGILFFIGLVGFVIWSINFG